ncbi:double zinc ribbon domain-containing protein [Nostoc commune]|uniref:double zinc ribbon domain-containing protein n=1 Tax=Nostoc commune TaxID=1178 RepID=UPI0039BF0828
MTARIFALINTVVDVLKFCPHCWIAGRTLEDIWLSPRSKFCFLWGTGLRNSCARCNEPIKSVKFRFCANCGFPFLQRVNEKNQFVLLDLIMSRSLLDHLVLVFGFR